MRRHTSELLIVFLFAGGVVIAQPATAPPASQPALKPPPPAAAAPAAPARDERTPPKDTPASAPASRPANPAVDIPVGATPSRPGAPAALPPPVGAVSDSESTESLLSRANELAGQKKYKDAQGLLGAVLARDPANVTANVYLAQISEKLSDYSAARDYYKSVIQIDPSNFEANLGMGRNFLNARYWRQAPAYLEKAANSAPQERRAEVYTMLAEAYKGERSSEKALDAAQKAVQVDDQYFAGVATLVALLADAKKFDTAVVQAKRLVQLAEEGRNANPGVLEKLQLLNGAYDTVINVLSEYHNELYERDARGNTTDRLKAGNETIATNVLLETAGFVAARADARKSLELHTAINIAEKGLQYSPRDVSMMIVLTQLYRDTLQVDKAVALCRKALEVDPQNAQVKQMLDRLAPQVQSIPPQ